LSSQPTDDSGKLSQQATDVARGISRIDVSSLS